MTLNSRQMLGKVELIQTAHDLNFLEIPYFDTNFHLSNHKCYFRGEHQGLSSAADAPALLSIH